MIRESERLFTLDISSGNAPRRAAAIRRRGASLKIVSNSIGDRLVALMEPANRSGNAIGSHHIAAAILAEDPACGYSAEELREMVVDIAVARRWPVAFGD
jgi:hypothetical protein